MKKPKWLNYLRAHRKKSGLSQHELGCLLGYRDQGPVSRHERSQVMPPLIAALGYQVIFRASVSAIFFAAHADVKETFEKRLSDLETSLQQRSAKDRDVKAVAQKLAWLKERKSL